MLAISVANVDQMSGGRVELGLGAGWYREEHEAYGLPFPDVAERFDRLAEQLEVVTGLWQTRPGERFDFAGEHVVLHDSPALPKPVQQRVPIIVGGAGRRRTPELAARFATEFNLPFGTIEQFLEQRRRVVEACEAIGRDPATLVFSTGPHGGGRRHRGRRVAPGGGESAARSSNCAATGVAGTIDEAVATMQKWQDAGAERMYLQVLDLADLDHLDALAATAQ